jgi:tRNA(Ile)-lysidine synthase
VGLDVRRPRRPESGNLQAWARDQRYGAAAELATGRGADVAAGHTATDQVETILYRVASSPSRRALLGMSPRDGRLVRPLLAFTREETAAYCRERGFSWCEDETNATDKYARGRVRAGLVPALEAVHPGAVGNVLALAGVLRDEGAVLDALVNETLRGGTSIELERLRALPPALRRLVVQRLADRAVGAPAAGVAPRADDVAALSEYGTAMLDLPSGVRAVAERGMLRFVPRTTTAGLRETGSPT